MGEAEFSFSVRPARSTDVAYVCNSWLRGIQRNTYFASRVPGPVFWSHHRPLVESHLAKSAVVVAHPDGDEDTILGWAALVYGPPATGIRFEPCYLPLKPSQNVLHWVYVRSAWRGIGIARKLVDAFGVEPRECSFPIWSFDCNSLVKKFPAEFNPYLHFMR